MRTSRCGSSGSGNVDEDLAVVPAKYITLIRWSHNI